MRKKSTLILALLAVLSLLAAACGSDEADTATDVQVVALAD